MNNTINNNNTSDLAHNNTTKNLNIHLYNDKDLPKLSIININIRSFYHNIESLIDYIIKLNNIDIIALTETWLGNDDYPQLYLNNYECFSQNRIKKLKLGGGVLLIFITKT